MIAISRKAYSRDRHKMQFTPMIDCVFLLLIFFLVATEVKPEEADYDTNMPAGRGTAEKEFEQMEVVTVWVADTPTGTVIRIGGERGQTSASFPALVDTLKRAKGKNTLVVIDGPSDVSMETIAKALDATVEAGIASMTFSDPEFKGKR